MLYRTLEYLVHHLSKVASHSHETGMTPKNIAIVWAPNLLRSKDLDMGGVAALQVYLLFSFFVCRNSFRL